MDEITKSYRGSIFIFNWGTLKFQYGPPLRGDHDEIHGSMTYFFLTDTYLCSVQPNEYFDPKNIKIG